MPKLSYNGWPNCYQLSNGVVDLVATTDVGPRIIRFGFAGGDNMFKEVAEMAGKTGSKEWLIYGGHRLWHSPEAMPRSYYPDNAPVTLTEHPGFIRLTPPREETTGIQKEMDVHLDPKAPHVQVIHRIRNDNLWTIELAPWALSVMDAGGKTIIPLPQRGPQTTDFVPTCVLTLWAYTNMSDPRWTWGQKYIMLQQDRKATAPQKIGVMNTSGWVACANKGNLFVKTFSYVPGATYPDGGCSSETWTNPEMIELETLGPLVYLAPSATVEYVENWYLFRDVPAPMNDADVEKNVLPKVKTIL